MEDDNAETVVYVYVGKPAVLQRPHAVAVSLGRKKEEPDVEPTQIIIIKGLSCSGGLSSNAIKSECIFPTPQTSSTHFGRLRVVQYAVPSHKAIRN